MRIWSAAVLGVALGFMQASTPPVVTGIDHVMVAVSDLKAAASRYRSLGFSLKPGQPHANGIGGDDVVNLARLEQRDLPVAGFRTKRAHHNRRAATEAA